MLFRSWAGVILAENVIPVRRLTAQLRSDLFAWRSGCWQMLYAESTNLSYGLPDRLCQVF